MLGCDDFLGFKERNEKSSIPGTDPRKTRETAVVSYLGLPRGSESRAYPGREVHSGAPVEQQGGHVDVPVVGGDVQRGEAALGSKEKHSQNRVPSTCCGHRAARKITWQLPARRARSTTQTANASARLRLQCQAVADDSVYGQVTQSPTSLGVVSNYLNNLPT